MIKVFFLILMFITSLLVTVNAKVSFLQESAVTQEGLYFWYPNNVKASHYNPNISPRGDCVTIINGYIYFGWYKGGMSNRNLMISRKKIGSDKWVHVQLPHTNTLIEPGNKWGDSHRTISVGVSKKDGTVHVFYDHHNEPLNYIISKKNIAFAADSEFKLSNFEKTREYFAEGENIRITYPKITQNSDGDVILNYRTGAAVGGNEVVHVYDGNKWTKAKNISDGRPGTLAENPKRIGWNYAYGKPYYNNGNVYYGFTVRWAEKKDQGIFNEGVYVAKCGPTFLDPWEDLQGKKHPLPIVDFSPFLIDVPPTHEMKGSTGGADIVVSEKGDVQVSYYGGGSQYKYTYSRKAGEKKFTRNVGGLNTGVSSGNRFYTINVAGTGTITIKSSVPGTMKYTTDLVHKTDKKFGVSASYVENGKLVVIASDAATNTDKKPIYCYEFDLGTSSTPTPDPIPDPPKETEKPVVTLNISDTTVTAGDYSLYVIAEVKATNVASAELYVNGKLLRKEGVSPYEWGNVEGSNNAKELDSLLVGTHTIKVVATDKDGLIGEASFTLTVKESEIIETPIDTVETPADSVSSSTKTTIEVNPELIAVYPNPATNFVFVNTKLEGKISLYNIAGNEFNVVKMHGRASQLDISNLPTGIYFITIKKDNKIEAVKSFYIRK